jgi:hypothetical protein
MLVHALTRWSKDAVNAAAHMMARGMNQVDLYNSHAALDCIMKTGAGAQKAYEGNMSRSIFFVQLHVCFRDWLDL